MGHRAQNGEWVSRNVGPRTCLLITPAQEYFATGEGERGEYK